MVGEGLMNQLFNLLAVGFAFFADESAWGAFRVCRHDALRP